MSKTLISLGFNFEAEKPSQTAPVSPMLQESERSVTQMNTCKKPWAADLD